MDLNCIVALALSLIFIIVAIVCAVVAKRRRRIDGQSGVRRKIFAPFNWVLLGFLLACIAMSYPVFFYGKFAGDVGYIKFSKSFMISILNALQMFFLNSDFSLVKEAISDSADMSTGIASAYTTYFAILYVIAPFLTFTFLLSFFKVFWVKLKYALYRSVDVYYMSELNERSMALARDIVKTCEGKKLIVFADVNADVEKNKEELVAEAKKMGALCHKNDIVEIRLKKAKGERKRKVYYISEDESKNLKQAIEMIDNYKAMPDYDNENMQFFVFANSKESELVLDSIERGKMKVRRVSEYWNIMLNTLTKERLFDTAIQKDGKNIINLLVVGVGSYGEELIKMACWLGQMPDYEINIYAFDKYDVEDRFKFIAPELVKMNGCEEDEEAHYKIMFNTGEKSVKSTNSDANKGIDVKSSKFCEEIEKIDQVTCAFIALGKDDLNVDIALKVKSILERKRIKNNSQFVAPVHTLVYDSVKADVLRRMGKLKSVFKGNADYEINITDSLATRYTVDVIERQKLEEAGLACHMRWAQNDSAKIEDQQKYERFEYFRKSSIAESIHTKLMKEIGKYELGEDGNVTKKVAVYEHMRWNAYMRAEGYVLGKIKNDIAKTHTDLVTYEALHGKKKPLDDAVKNDNSGE